MRKTLALTGLLFSPALFADAATDLVEKLAAIESLSTTFEQVTMDRDGTRLQESTGSMDVARPSKFRWHATEPYEQLVVSDGKVVWIHDIDLEQVIERALSDEIGNTPALLFSGDPAKVSEAFHVAEVERRRQRVTWRLTPREEDQMFTLLEITFQRDEPTIMRLADALGQETSIEFHDLTLNGDIDPARFRFELPDGADLISELDDQQGG